MNVILSTGTKEQWHVIRVFLFSQVENKTTSRLSEFTKN